MKEEYALLDSGDGKKWERFGPYTFCRPSPQAVWKPQHRVEADAVFSRDPESRWILKQKLIKEWSIDLCGVKMKIAPTDFGHLGVFPEHAALWDFLRSSIQKGDRILNLFAYSGGATLASAQAGAHVCHLDASKGMVDWAKENAALNGLKEAPIRWIVDDAIKFLKREINRGSVYEGIILDPPTFGRGSKGEVFKIEEEIVPLLELCRKVLSNQPKFVLFSSHTPGFTPIVLEHLLFQIFGRKGIGGEMVLSSENCLTIPSGAFAKVCYV